MKKLLSKKIILAGLSALFVLSSCSSSKTSFSVLENASEKSSKDVPGQKKFVLFKYGNVGDYITIDETSVFTTTPVGSLKQKAATVTVDPKKKMAGFGSGYMAAYYYLFLEKSSREMLRNAINDYFNDFDNKNLKRKAGNTNDVYGKIPVTLRWGTLSNSTPSNGTGKMYCGYKFNKKSPYFAITIYPVHNNRYEIVDTVETESLLLNYYFTRAQLKELLNMMTEENIEKIYNEYSDVGNKGVVHSADDYDKVTDNEDEYVEAEVK